MELSTKVFVRISYEGRKAEGNGGRPEFVIVPLLRLEGARARWSL